MSDVASQKSHDCCLALKLTLEAAAFPSFFNPSQSYSSSNHDDDDDDVDSNVGDNIAQPYNSYCHEAERKLQGHVRHQGQSKLS